VGSSSALQGRGVSWPSALYHAAKKFPAARFFFLAGAKSSAGERGGSA